MAIANTPHPLPQSATTYILFILECFVRTNVEQKIKILSSKKGNGISRFHLFVISLVVRPF